ncbi:MAG: DNA repair protein RecO [Deltaproteobacteria bacterium]|nr:DNA repair protein RecO [Deltaproteobacteria bacterium]
MAGPSQRAFVLRLVPYGENDLVVTLLSREQGLFPVMAKSAKKSRKRFGGALELFSLVNAVASSPRGGRGGMGLLNEASAERVYEGVRGNVVKTAFASCWAEVACLRVEEGQGGELFPLFEHCLNALDRSRLSGADVHLLFLVRFFAAMGLLPRLDACAKCEKPLAPGGTVRFFPAKGGMVCAACAGRGGMACHPGTVKQLAWAARGDLATAGRIRFSSQAAEEGRRMLERFLAFHLEVELKSLRFLEDILKQGQTA